MESVEFPKRSVDPDGLDEFSVVFTERSLNHMSKTFVRAMCDISEMLKQTYAADRVAIVPGGGTFGMESVARLPEANEWKQDPGDLKTRSKNSDPYE